MYPQGMEMKVMVPYGQVGGFAAWSVAKGIFEIITFIGIVMAMVGFASARAGIMILPYSFIALAYLATTIFAFFYSGQVKAFMYRNDYLAKRAVMSMSVIFLIKGIINMVLILTMVVTAVITLSSM